MRGVVDAESASQPLIAESRQYNNNYDVEEEQGPGTTYNDADVDEASEDETNEALKPNRFVWILTVAAGISGLLFGYDTGVISSTLISIHSDLSSRHLTTLDKSLITSCTSFLALLASPIAGYLADYFGRKRVILLASALFIIGAILQALSATVISMVVGRSVVGAAIGAASFVVPLYIGELAPGRWRGRLVTISILFITGGQVVAYIIGWAFSTTPNGWRWMVGLGALPAALQLLVLLPMPETPRWLTKVGRRDEARIVLGKVHGGEKSEGGAIERVLKRVESEQSEEERAKKNRLAARSLSGRWRRILGASDGLAELLMVGENWRALVIACVLQGSQQLCGFNSLMYFSATIFSLVGFHSPTLASLSIALTNFFGTLIAFHAIDRIGRRRILLLSIPFMIVGLACCAFSFHFIDLEAGTPSSISFANPATAVYILLVSLVLYTLAYALSLGNIPWHQSELFPLPVRSIGSSISTATNWFANTIVGLTFLPMLDLLTPTGTFGVYAIVCGGILGAVWWIYPETAGLELEDVGTLLGEGWGVEESVRRWRRIERGGGDRDSAGDGDENG